MRLRRHKEETTSRNDETTSRNDKEDTRPHNSVTTSLHDKGTKNNVTTSIHHDKTTPQMKLLHNVMIKTHHVRTALQDIMKKPETNGKRYFVWLVC